MNEVTLLCWLVWSAGEIDRLTTETRELRSGLIESITSEDENRGLRWEAEKAEAQAQYDRREALQLAEALWTTCLVPGGQLDVLRLEKQIEQMREGRMRERRYLRGMLEYPLKRIQDAVESLNDD